MCSVRVRLYGRISIQPCTKGIFIAQQSYSRGCEDTYPCLYNLFRVSPACAWYNRTWNTTWFSTFWRQRISSTVTATNAAFVNRILRRDSVFQQDGPSIAKAPPYPRFYYYDLLLLNRRSCNYRNPHSTRDKAS